VLRTRPHAVAHRVSQSSMKQVRILVVESDHGSRSGLRRVLQHEGYEVVTAETGQSALSIIRDEVVDLVVMDLRMPDMDGVDLICSLKALRASLPIVVASVVSGPESIQATASTVEAYLIKPVDVEDLLQVVARSTGAGRGDR
jgi:CheY-like chemotaxis protein